MNSFFIVFSWTKHEKIIGKITQNFSIILDVFPSKHKDAFIAIDNINMRGCFPEKDNVHPCTPSQFKCSVSNICINGTKICDINRDCQFGDDEAQNCGKY